MVFFSCSLQRFCISINCKHFKNTAIVAWDREIAWTHMHTHTVTRVNSYNYVGAHPRNQLFCLNSPPLQIHEHLKQAYCKLVLTLKIGDLGSVVYWQILCCYYLPNIIKKMNIDNRKLSIIFQLQLFSLIFTNTIGLM